MLYLILISCCVNEHICFNVVGTFFFLIWTNAKIIIIFFNYIIIKICCWHVIRMVPTRPYFKPGKKPGNYQTLQGILGTETKPKPTLTVKNKTANKTTVKHNSWQWAFCLGCILGLQSPMQGCKSGVKYVSVHLTCGQKL